MPDRKGELERGKYLNSNGGTISLCPRDADFLIQFCDLNEIKLFELILVVLFLPPQGVSASLLTPKALVAFNGSLQAPGNVGLKKNVPQVSYGFSSGS